jgi:predicted amidohydrolase
MKNNLKYGYLTILIAIFLTISSCVIKDRLEINQDLSSPLLENEYLVREIIFSADEGGLTIGLANIKNYIYEQDDLSNNIEVNKNKIIKVIDQLKKYNVNMILLPEFSLTGYFWNDDNNSSSHTQTNEGSKECWKYMSKGTLNKHKAWLEEDLKARLDDVLHYIIFNTIRDNPAPASGHGSHKKFLNSTYVIDKKFNCKDLTANEDSHIYDKTFLPGIEKIYTTTNGKDFLVLKTKWGNFGFTTCYDMCFSQLYQEYTLVHDVHGIIELSSWRGMGKTGKREYQLICDGKPCAKKFENYYGFLWDLMNSDRAASNQIWMISSNAVGHQNRGDYDFWGGSGVWTPSGINIVQASNNTEELLVIKNVQIKKEVEKEHQDFEYKDDFNLVYKPIPENINGCSLESCASFTRWKKKTSD